MQRLLCGKLERDLGRPIDQGSSNGTLVKSTLGQPEGSLVPKGNIVPQEPDQVMCVEEVRGDKICTSKGNVSLAHRCKLHVHTFRSSVALLSASL